MSYFQRVIEFLHKKYCKQPSLIEVLEKELNIANYEINFSKMDEKEAEAFGASASRVLQEYAFTENLSSAINAQANLTFSKLINNKTLLRDSTVAIMSLRSFLETLKKQAAYFENKKIKKPSDPYQIG